jgi:hypothetical protein
MTKERIQKNDTTAGVLHKKWVGLTKEDFYKKDDAKH